MTQSESTAYLCDEHLRALVRANLRQFPVQPAAVDLDRRAAVALTIAEVGHGAELEGLPNYDRWQDAAALILTRRAETLNHHPGQWALPGGRLDAGESPEQAALRELSEEVGVSISAEHVLGRLDDFVTRSGFVMTPVVVWGGSGLNLTPNPAEVASTHRIPVAEFLRGDAPMLDHDELDGEHPVLRMPVGESFIAAPTAAILYQFREVCILGRATRVAHYEQPQFAWK